MTENEKMLLASLVFSHAVAEALITKGLVSKADLQNAVTMLGYDAPIPPQVEKDVRAQIDGLPGDSSSVPGSKR